MFYSFLAELFKYDIYLYLLKFNCEYLKQKFLGGIFIRYHRLGKR